MKLDLSQIRAITLGAEEVTLENDGFHFYRFNRRQMEYYQASSPNDFYIKCFATSGVQLRFSTDSENLHLDLDVTPGSSRTYFSVDVFVNGNMLDSIDNLTDHLPQDYTTVKLPLGAYSKTFDLGKGSKDVCVYLPWSVCVVLKDLILDDGAKILPLKPKHKLLAFGDSITQGYDAKHPSNKYITRLAGALDAEECNKAIGGEEFCPAIVEAEEGAAPDYIVVAYGTNDWSHSTRESLIRRCEAVYTTLREKYPNAKIIAMTPIWRLDWQLDKPVGPFHDVEQIIRKAVANLENVSVIRCFDLVPKDINYFADLRLHPNDAGFDHYFRNLYQAVSKVLEK